MIWGLKHLSRLLTSTGKPSDGATFVRLALSEKGRDDGDGPLPSFSWIAGSIGALSLVATFVAVGYWTLYALYLDGDLQRLKDLWWFFLAGSALFLPYAFNRLSTIGKP